MFVIRDFRFWGMEMNILFNYHLLVLPRKENKHTEYGYSVNHGVYRIFWGPVLVTEVSDNGRYVKNMTNGLVVKPAFSR
jgi:hypothetical protein